MGDTEPDTEHMEQHMEHMEQDTEHMEQDTDMATLAPIPDTEHTHPAPEQHTDTLHPMALTERSQLQDTEDTEDTEPDTEPDTEHTEPDTEHTEPDTDMDTLAAHTVLHTQPDTIVELNAQCRYSVTNYLEWNLF